MPEYSISDAEWEVMQIIWRRRSATAAEVIADLAQVSRWRHRTIRTLLGRLVEKQILAAEPDGHRYIYRPLVGRQKCVRQEARSFVQRVFGGDTSELLVHFVRDAKISSEQIDELKRILDAKRDSQE